MASSTITCSDLSCVVPGVYAYFLDCIDDFFHSEAGYVCSIDGGNGKDAAVQSVGATVRTQPFNDDDDNVCALTLCCLGSAEDGCPYE